MSSSATAPPAVAEEHCAHCGASLAEDQEWCLECGTARTLIHRAPDWRVPLVIVGGVVLLVFAAAVFALVTLSADANRSTGAPAAKAPAATTAASPPATATAAAPTTSPATTSTPAAAAPASVPGWPLGLGGWTVVLSATRAAGTADALARKLAAAGLSVGVLESSQHASLAPGFWVVYSGRYPTGPDARAAANRLKAAGQPQAHARMVASPGGG